MLRAFSWLETECPQLFPDKGRAGPPRRIGVPFARRGELNEQ